jgi:dihydroorotase
MNIRIINGKRLSDDFTWVDSKSIDIQNGVITAFDEDNEAADKVIDAKACLIMPGLTDLNVSLREPGYTAKGSVESETKAAVAGGVTKLCCSPETAPVNDSRAVTKLIKELALSANNCDVLPLAALTKGLSGERLSEYAALKSAQCIALSNAYNPIKTLEITKRCFEYAKTHGLSVFIHPIEPSLHQGAMHEGDISTTIGLKGISPLAETIAVAQLIQLAEATGVHLHLSQLSVADSVELLRKAKAKGLDVTADVAIQNLLYTDAKVESFTSIYHCLPPLRGEKDRQALLEGVKDGVIDAVTSAHQPHEAAAKQMPFAETEPGMSTIQFLLPMAQILDRSGELTLARFIQSMTSGAARVIKQKESVLTVGAVASLSVYNPEVEYCVTSASMVSRGKNSPLLGSVIKGKTKVTLYKGRVVYST